VFDGFSRHYQTRAARAEFELADADLRSTEQKIALEVWQAYQTLESQTHALDSTLKLLGFATKSLEVAQGRYKAGVGSTLELLEAQRAMADAAQQRINALSSWRATRLRLAASLGRLGFWSVSGS
jgi:outer membrane protein